MDLLCVRVEGVGVGVGDGTSPMRASKKVDTKGNKPTMISVH